MERPWHALEPDTEHVTSGQPQFIDSRVTSISVLCGRRLGRKSERRWEQTREPRGDVCRRCALASQRHHEETEDVRQQLEQNPELLSRTLGEDVTYVDEEAEDDEE